MTDSDGYKRQRYDKDIMLVSAIIAEFLGYFILFVGLVAILRPSWITDILEKANGEGKFGMVFGFSEAILGAVIVYFHNIWAIGHEVVVTLIGWYLLIDGVADFLVPQKFREKVSSQLEEDEEEAKDFSRGMGVPLILLGSYLIYSTF